jgi:hypothetical protein
LPALFPKSDADANLGSVLGNYVGKDSEQTNRSEDKRDESEGKLQGCIEAGGDDGLAKDLIHGEGIGHG